MNKRFSSKYTISLILPAFLVVSACSGSDDSSPSASPSSSTSSVSTGSTGTTSSTGSTTDSTTTTTTTTAATTKAGSNSSGGSHGLSTGAIVGIAVGGAALAAIAGLITYNALKGKSNQNADVKPIEKLDLPQDSTGSSEALEAYRSDLQNTSNDFNSQISQLQDKHDADVKDRVAYYQSHPELLPENIQSPKWEDYSDTIKRSEFDDKILPPIKKAQDEWIADHAEKDVNAEELKQANSIYLNYATALKTKINDGKSKAINTVTNENAKQTQAALEALRQERADATKAYTDGGMKTEGASYRASVDQLRRMRDDANSSHDTTTANFINDETKKIGVDIDSTSMDKPSADFLAHIQDRQQQLVKIAESAVSNPLAQKRDERIKAITDLANAASADADSKIAANKTTASSSSVADAPHATKKPTSQPTTAQSALADVPGANNSTDAAICKPN